MVQDRQTPPDCPLKPPLSCVRGWFNAHISVVPPMSRNLLAGGVGAPSVRGVTIPISLQLFTLRVPEQLLRVPVGKEEK